MEIVKNTNCLFAIGKNAKTNWQLLDNADNHDIFIHLKDKSSPYVIIALRDLKNGSFTKEDIIQGCTLCKKSNNKEQVMYTEVKNVKKGRRIGSAVIDKFKIMSV